MDIPLTPQTPGLPSAQPGLGRAPPPPPPGCPSQVPRAGRRTPRWFWAGRRSGVTSLFRTFLLYFPGPHPRQTHHTLPTPAHTSLQHLHAYALPVYTGPTATHDHRPTLPGLHGLQAAIHTCQTARGGIPHHPTTRPPHFGLPGQHMPHVPRYTQTPLPRSHCSGFFPHRWGQQDGPRLLGLPRTVELAALPDPHERACCGPRLQPCVPLFPTPTKITGPTL